MSLRAQSRRFVGLSAVVVLAAAPVASPVAAETFEWALESAPGSSGPTWLSQPCGSYGVFRFCNATAGGCAPPGGGGLSRAAGSRGAMPSKLLASGSVVDPLIYPGPPGPASPGHPPELLQKDLAPTPAAVPCDDGSCFTSFADLKDPWVAVVDWNQLHGWSVGWAVGQASTRNLAVGRELGLGLFRVDESRYVPFAARGVTDVQVISALCEIADWVEVGRPEPIPPPRVVNLSLGRFASPEEDVACLDSSSSQLSCQLRRVIAHLEELAGEPESTLPRVVAAAGNYRSLMFPAVDPRVDAVESLDLEHFAANGAAVPSWESPRSPNAAALMPGGGLCLREPEAAAGWPAPAGTSYSTALFSGWLATALVEGWVGGAGSSIPWRPTFSCTATTCQFEMKAATSAASTAGLAQMLLRIVSFDGRCEDTTQAEGLDLVTALVKLTNHDEIPRQSFLERVDGLYVPSPDPNPCVPCEGAPRPPRARLSQGWSLTSRAAPTPTAKDLKLGLAFSAPLPEGVELVAVLLRVGESFYRPAVPLDLRSIANGQVRTLTLQGGASLLAESKTQGSLLFVLEALEGDRYWSSTPLWLTY